MERVIIENLEKYIGEKILIKGWVHRVRKLKAITFLILRDRTGMVQCVVDNNFMDISSLKLESVISIEGLLKEGTNTLNPFEVLIEKLEVLNEVQEELPIEINKKELEVNLDTMLNNRVLSLRQEKKHSIFKIQGIIAEGFREFLIKQGFTEIFTPKIVAEGAEGGTDMFEIKYFENKAYLAQSPQFYKQMMVGAGYERVFEVGAVYRAEQHNTNRHLNEYISMDLEMGFIENEEDLMKLEESLLKYILTKLENQGEKCLKILEVSLPEIKDSIPKLSFSNALEILKTQYGKTDLEGDLDPEGEKLICKYSKEKLGSEFLFLTNYPRRKRPMYTMPLGEEETRSFDLLFRGLEITTGGQRIHSYNMLIENILYKGLTPENYEGYTNTFKYGMPPHGGLAIGLERLTAQLLGLSNVRETSLFPRDRTRLTP
ncbi:aspartate--tRNA(Asn) ligase [Clostridium tunisiense]|uniref:aspartate--tRNA(Asn) ligase n=1 Tax=Clostridium tunisiense TaxID=219748 RepID=UPI00031E1BEE|nr:aspartate--tRNA(Asn) ligase [Clostridium tunisiense]